MSSLREAAQQALEALEWYVECSVVAGKALDAADTLRAALAEPVPTVAENATTQQQLEEAPPSEYRRGYWDGFAIGKREGRIEAEDALAEPVQEFATTNIGCLGMPVNTPVTPPQTAEPVQEPLTIERLRDALVASRIIPPAAVEDPDEYDDGVTLFRIEALHRRIT